MNARLFKHRPAALPIWGLVCAVLLTLALPSQAGSSPEDAFARLKSLAGTWQGTAGSGEGGGVSVDHRFQVTAGGSVVLETLFAGSEHEMLNVYRLEDGNLVLTHYCDSGNQPEMKLDSESPDGELRFVFTGGTNLDPGKDAHIHGGRLLLRSEDRIESRWEVHVEGQLAGVNRFDLQR